MSDYTPKHAIILSGLLSAGITTIMFLWIETGVSTLVIQLLEATKPLPKYFLGWVFLTIFFTLLTLPDGENTQGEAGE